MEQDIQKNLPPVLPPEEPAEPEVPAESSGFFGVRVKIEKGDTPKRDSGDKGYVKQNEEQEKETKDHDQSEKDEEKIGKEKKNGKDKKDKKEKKEKHAEKEKKEKKEKHAEKEKKEKKEKHAEKEKKEKGEKHVEKEKKEKGEKHVEKEKNEKVLQEQKKPKTAAVSAVVSAASSSAGGGEIVPASGVGSGGQKKEKKKAATDDDELDIAHLFLLDESTKPVDEASTKDKFLAAEIVVPGVVMKKFKMALDSAGASAEIHFAMLGSKVITKYKAARTVLEGMVLADLSKMTEEKWVQTAAHLESRGLTAILTSEGSAVCPTDVS